MATVALNKSSLEQQRDQLALYQRFLPSLDLKRRQLLAELNLAGRQLEGVRQQIDQFNARLVSLMSLLGASGFDLSGLVQTRSVTASEENVVGVRMPVLQEVAFDVAEYSTLARPFWVDALARAVQEMVTLHIRRQVALERARRLRLAVRRITQRVNLFEKVLIPTARRNIQRIVVYLADAERAAVVRSKFAKAKHQQQARP